MLSFVLLVPAVAVYLLQRYWVSRRHYVTVTGKAGPETAIKSVAPWARVFLLAACGIVALVILYFWIVNTAGRWNCVNVEGVDPFSGRRVPVADGLPLEAQVDVRSPRQSFGDYPRREIHLYATVEAWRAGQPGLTVYYLGVPDTTPEFASETSMLFYLATAPSGRR